jgi:hypothetical protein
VRAGPRADLLVVASAQGAAVTLGTETAWIVDTDLDGVLGSPGDGLVAPGTRTVAPWTGEIWLRGAAWRLERPAEPGRVEWSLAEVAMPYPDRADHAAAWRLVNAWRQRCGMAPVAYDSSLEDGIRKHAAYCRRNRYQGHHEEKDKPGYTPEGAKAGVTSVLNYPPWRESLIVQMDDLLHTLYHRSALMAGGLVRSALVQADGMFGMRVGQDDEAPHHLAPLVFPPHGMTGAPRMFHPPGENPPPFDGFRRFQAYGTSVGVYSTNWIGMDELKFVPELVLEGPMGPVQGHFHYPGKVPKGVPVDYLANVALTPLQPLLPETLYRVRARIAMPVGPPFSYEWEFTTGK